MAARDEIRRDAAGIERDLAQAEALLADCEAHGLERVATHVRIRCGTLRALLAEARERANAPRCCATCRHDLGGGWGNCRINLEAECGAGEFEAWEPR